MNEELIERALPELRGLLDRYEWEDVYNMDETALFTEWRCVP